MGKCAQVVSVRISVAVFSHTANNYNELKRQVFSLKCMYADSTSYLVSRGNLESSIGDWESTSELL